jgi:hypothetical protein
MKAIFLPKLIENHTTPRPMRPAAWEPEHDVRILETIPNDLDIQVKRVRGEIINAIPTAFARPALFAEALLARSDDEHPLHQRAKAEWRGLLGAFCFKDTYGINLSATAVPIPRRERSGLGDEERVFVHVLDRLLPSESWRGNWLIEVDGILLGGTSPLSLFFTAAEYSCPESIPWREEQDGQYVLSDPGRYFLTNKSEDELCQLRYWLTEIRKDSQTTISVGSLRKVVNELLDEWIVELPVLEAGTAFEMGYASLIESNPYAPFSRPVGARVRDFGPDPAMRSDVVLESSKPCSPAPLVICRDTLRSGVRISGPFFGDAIPLPSEARGQSLRTRTGEPIQRRWIDPEKAFFPEYLVELPLRDTTLNSSFVSGPNCSLPLTTEFLDYFGYEDAKTRLRMHRRSDGVMQVTLDVPISSGQVRLTKAYTKDRIKSLQQPPILDLWPNFVADGEAEDGSWRSYYCFLSFRGLPTGGQDIDAKNYSFRPVGVHFGFTTDDFRTIWKLDRYPEAIECGYLGDSAGLILPTSPKRARSAGLRWVVGIDLGTSNTNVFYLPDGSEEAMKLHFADRCVPICAPDEGIRIFHLYKRFYPVKYAKTEDVVPDFATLFNVTEEGADRREAVLGGVAFLKREIEDWEANILKSNLKWATGNDRQLISAFIEHVLLMVAAEAKSRGVSEIDLRWSFPSAFSEPWQIGLNTFWKEVGLSVLSRSVGITVREGIPETVAACHYFASELRATTAADDPTVFIDIGGGTTDIAFWLDDKLALHTSVKLAANDVVGNYARSRRGFIPALLDALGIKGDSHVIIAHFEKHPYAVLNALLQGEDRHRGLMQSLFAKNLSESAEFKSARTMVFTFLAGMLYYIGLMTKYVEKARWAEKKSDGLRTFANISIFFGGKGARLTDWPADFSSYSHLLADMVRAGYGSKGIEVYLQRSQRPKEEVGRGLVYGTDITKEIPKPAVIAGEESYRIGEREVVWDEQLPRESFKEITPPEKGFKNIEEFVRLLNVSLSDLDLDHVEIPGNLRNLVIQRIANIANAGNEAVLQSLFTLEVEIILESAIGRGNAARSAH